MWQILLWGDLQDHSLISSLKSKFPPLSQIAKSRGWLYSRGFQVKGGCENDAEHLLGMRLVPAEAIEAFRVIDDATERFDHAVLHRPRSEKLFEAPVLLIRRGIRQGRPVAWLSTQDVTFNDSVIGLSGPQEDIDHLRIVSGIVHSSLAQYFHFLTSSSWGAERNYIELGEHFSLPVPALGSDSQPSVLEVVKAIESFGLTSELQDQLDSCVFEAYGLLPEDVDRVTDMVNVTIDHFRRGENSVGVAEPSRKVLDEYRECLIRGIETVFPSTEIEVVFALTPDFYIVASCQVTPPGHSQAGSYSSGTRTADSSSGIGGVLLQAVEHQDQAWSATSTVLQPSLLVLEGDRAHVVKPRETRFWTKTRARSDAGDVMAALAGRGRVSHASS
ncbi:MAG: hypothetical protein R2704_00620 [Microthrixaceae bacterium]